MQDGAEEKLARVTYLPGVKPPSAPFVSPADDAGHIALETIPGLVKASEIVPGAVVRAPAFDESNSTEPASRESKRAHNVGLNAIARRGVSSSEMANLLARRELDEESIESEINRLEKVGLLDDTELARTLVRTLRERKGLGRSAVVAELRRRKIEPDAIDEVLDEAYPDDAVDELTRAREVAVKRVQQLRSLDPETARRRLGAYLMRRGYSGSIVSSAVAAALAPNHPSVRGPRFE